SCSHGVIKVDDQASFRKAAAELLKRSDIVVCQNFVPSEFDWRIGILNGEPLYACQYYMAPNHWQIYNHTARNKSDRLGFFNTLPIRQVPEDVLKTAVRAAKLVGNGLYGVDLKETPDGCVTIMEVNDNPTIDRGIEDEVVGEKLYRKILAHMIRMIEE